MGSSPLFGEYRILEVRSMSYRFTVPGPAVPQGRPIFTTRGGKRWAIDPPRSREYKAKVRAYARRVCQPHRARDKPWLAVSEYRPIPKSWSRKKRAAAREQKIYPTVRPDFDNVIKAIADALNGVLWEDDRQVVDGRIQRFYSDDPRVEVEIEAICPEEAQDD